jgi:hypothetical protein
MKHDERIMLFLNELSFTNKGIFDGSQGSPKVDWWEKQIFNEDRLYTALGKEDARSVLSIWQRYKETIQVLRIIELILKFDEATKDGL